MKVTGVSMIKRNGSRPLWSGHRRLLLRLVALCPLVVGCGGNDPVSGGRLPNQGYDRACGLGSPGVQAEFSGSGTNASLGPFSGDIQRVSAPTATPNYLSNSLTTSGRKFVLIVGGGIAVKDAYIGEGGTYLSYTEGGGTANAKVWVAQGGVFGISVCPGGAYALVGFGPDANNDTGIPMTPSPQSSATGTLHVKMYVRLP